MDFKLDIGILTESIEQYKKVLAIAVQERETMNAGLDRLYNEWTGQAKDKFEELHKEKQKLYLEFEEDLKRMIDILENEQKPKDTMLKRRCENFVNVVSRGGCSSENTPDDTGVITLLESGAKQMDSIMIDLQDMIQV